MELDQEEKRVPQQINVLYSMDTVLIGLASSVLGWRSGGQ